MDEARTCGMGFMTNVFIRINTPELRQELENLGYKKSKFYSDDIPGDWLLCNSKDYKGNIIKGEYIDFCEDEIDLDETLGDYGIDCGINTDLFLAISALRNDTDKDQWFTDGEKWYKSRSKKVPRVRFHKATIEELIKNFK